MTVEMFPVDKIPWILIKPTAIMVNTAAAAEPKEQWIAIYIDQDRCATSDQNHSDTYTLNVSGETQSSTSGTRKNCKAS